MSTFGDDLIEAMSEAVAYMSGDPGNTVTHEMEDDRTMDEEIDLNQWVAEEQDRIKRFVAMWIKSQQANPERFPKKLPAGEWDEQFRAFESGEC